ncbi:unnamed protein product [Cuscuta europaea]|uniref:Uncharacterized protein n=1 Tax=Cuscuta europaea TaxID=41803 RepID=A0A9P1E8M9_CUSEU|nr:unnamed protein product [Cuscuta europaea]
MAMAMAVAPPPPSALTNHPRIVSPTTTPNRLSLPAIPYASRATSFGIARASDPKREAPDPKSGGRNPSFVSLQEDLEYLVKLGVWSAAGAAAIKYGSIMIPQMTKPNLAEAISIITAPVFVALVLLINQSRIQSSEEEDLS